MCEFCLQHGEGKKWYLQACNYGEELLNDIRRRRFIEEFFTDPASLRSQMHKLAELDKAPAAVKAIVRKAISMRMKRDHFGQVLPIEDVEAIFGFVNSIVRVACYCRKATIGQEKRYCYGVSMGPNGGKLAAFFEDTDSSYDSGPQAAGIEVVSKDEALAAFREHESEGLCHTVWTFRAPFIGGICNCDRTDCLAMRCTVSHDVPVMFRAEYVAEVAPDTCTGCRQCMRVCQFGAISYSASNRKTAVDPHFCFGCGICRRACQRNAIQLKDRRSVPAAAKRW